MGIISDKVERVERVLAHQLAIQQKIFSYLNSYAKGEHMNQFSRVDPEGVLAQVYGDLASGFEELEYVVNKLNKEDE
jgi:hypothetical protein